MPSRKLNLSGIRFFSCSPRFALPWWYVVVLVKLYLQNTKLLRLVLGSQAVDQGGVCAREIPRVVCLLAKSKDSSRLQSSPVYHHRL